MNIYLSRIHFPVTTLGPGQRIGIWFQGCSIQCPGCISADTWNKKSGLTSISEIINLVAAWAPCADGVTISGGEPFDQSEALGALLLELKRIANFDILVYSGYQYEKIIDQVERYTGLIDAIITEPYDYKAPQTLALRGSDNQILRCLTALGYRKFQKYNRQLKCKDKVLDIMFDNSGTVWLAGIPSRDDLHNLNESLIRDGNKIVITNDKRDNQ